MTLTKRLIIWMATVLVLTGCSSGSRAGGTDEPESVPSAASTDVSAAPSSTSFDAPGPTLLASGEESDTTMSTSSPADRLSSPTVTGNTSVPAEPAMADVPPDWMSRVLAAAEKESGVAATEIAVLRAESLVWSDSSLGCPEPGGVYTQATVDGFRVELAAGALELDYRIGTDGLFVLCKQFEAPPVTVWPGDPDE